MGAKVQIGTISPGHDTGPSSRVSCSMADTLSDFIVKTLWNSNVAPFIQRPHGDARQASNVWRKTRLTGHWCRLRHNALGSNAAGTLARLFPLSTPALSSPPTLLDLPKSLPKVLIFPTTTINLVCVLLSLP